MTKIDEATLAAKVPDLAARREAERLYTALVLAENALSAAEEALPDTPEVVNALERCEAAQRGIHAAYEERENARKALYEARTAMYNARGYVLDESLQSLKDDVETATEAYSGHALTIDEDYDAEDGIARCAASGLPLLDSDELLEDEDTGQKVLRCLVLPPRHADEAAAQANEVAA